MMCNFCKSVSAQLKIFSSKQIQSLNLFHQLQYLKNGMKFVVEVWKKQSKKRIHETIGRTITEIYGPVLVKMI